MLPNADRAVIDLDKLQHYALSADHTRGRHKARVFASALGLRTEDSEWLRDRILEGILSTTALESPASAHGRRYQVDLDLHTDQGAATVRTAWIVRPGEAFPRLITCYVL